MSATTNPPTPTAQVPLLEPAGLPPLTATANPPAPLQAPPMFPVGSPTNGPLADRPHFTRDALPKRRRERPAWWGWLAYALVAPAVLARPASSANWWFFP